MLVIFHWIMAVLIGIVSLFPIVHLMIGIGLISGRFGGEQVRHDPDFPAEAMGWFFVVFAVLWIVLASTFAISVALAARYLAQRRRRMFCMIVAGFLCLGFPLGTALGVFTLVVLNRESVRVLFGEPSDRASAIS